MEITVINTDKNTWHSDQLKKEAEKKGFACNIITATRDIPTASAIGDVLIMRTTSFGSKRKKMSFLSSLKKRTLVFNWTKIRKPSVGVKSVQQKILQNIDSINTIKTFNVKSVKRLKSIIRSGQLSFPFIQKPDSGSQGKDVIVVKNLTELKKIPAKFERTIFQNFIPNSGDYRVLILGGKPLGAIKRIAPNKSMINNFSLGGKVKKVTEKKILEKIYPIALKAASTLGLSYCGIDIIFNEKDKKYYFLESNSAAQWKGFQLATGINVAREIINFCQEIKSREKLSAYKAVENSYISNSDFLEKYRFHFFSRMWFWTKKQHFKDSLDLIRTSYTGENPQETEEKIQNILEKKVDDWNIKNRAKRLKYLKKYPDILNYEALFSFRLFCKSAYEMNIDGLINKHVSEKKLLKISKALLNDTRAMRELSTFAINFLYLMRDFLKNDSLVDIKHFLKISKKIRNKEMQLYFLTHCIVQESCFYQKPVKNNLAVYFDMLVLAEKTISRNYKKVSLDAKLEFLVCSKILNYKSKLKEKILNEANSSLSPLGNFIVDTLNTHNKNPLKNNFLTAEHRNVLFLMANSRYNTK